MDPKNIAVLEEHIRHWHMIKFTGSFNMNYEVKQAIHRVWKEELKATYNENLWCGNCVVNMMKVIYGHYERTAPNPILESVLTSTTLINENSKDFQAKKQPRKSKSNKG